MNGMELRLNRMWLSALFVLCSCALTGCVAASKYNSMLAQQQALESSLRAEIGADQVEIQQLENGIRARMSSDLLYRDGSVELTQPSPHATHHVAPQIAF